MVGLPWTGNFGWGAWDVSRRGANATPLQQIRPETAPCRLGVVVSEALQVDAKRVQLGKEANKVLKAAA
jgi:hypothetical protein